MNQQYRDGLALFTRLGFLGLLAFVAYAFIHFIVKFW